MASLARALNRPAGSVASNIYGYRANPELQQEIAAFLGMAPAELFGANGGQVPTSQDKADTPRSNQRPDTCHSKKTA